MPGTKNAEVKKINMVPVLLGADSLWERQFLKKMTITQLTIVSTTVIRPQSKTAGCVSRQRETPMFLKNWHIRGFLEFKNLRWGKGVNIS